MILITGVTSLTLDSLTSGFNICENVSDYVALNDALGFTYNEVIDLVKYMEISNTEETLQILKENYNGYLFSPNVDERVYNSNMILFFMNSYVNRGGFPKRLADPNIRGDYSKLSSMLDLYSEGIEKETVLQSLLSNESVIGNLVTSFSLALQFLRDHFISLLYYLGLLTLDKEITGGRYQFKTPNKVIREVYYDYYFDYLTRKSNITTDMVSEAVKVFDSGDDISALVEIVEMIGTGE